VEAWIARRNERRREGGRRADGNEGKASRVRIVVEKKQKLEENRTKVVVMEKAGRLWRGEDSVEGLCRSGGILFSVVWFGRYFGAILVIGWLAGWGLAARICAAVVGLPYILQTAGGNSV